MNQTEITFGWVVDTGRYWVAFNGRKRTSKYLERVDCWLREHDVESSRRYDIMRALRGLKREEVREGPPDALEEALERVALLEQRLWESNSKISEYKRMIDANTQVNSPVGRVPDDNGEPAARDDSTKDKEE